MFTRKFWRIVAQIERAIVAIAAALALFPLWQFWDERDERKLDRAAAFLASLDVCVNFAVTLGDDERSAIFRGYGTTGPVSLPEAILDTDDAQTDVDAAELAKLAESLLSSNVSQTTIKVDPSDMDKYRSWLAAQRSTVEKQCEYIFGINNSAFFDN